MRSAALSEYGIASLDLKAAIRFIRLLTGGQEIVTFQTFCDGTQARPHLSRILHGSISEHMRALTSLNEAGAGIFAMINAGDLKGRKAAHVNKVRALFVDLDGAPVEPLAKASIPPDVLVESSPGRWHAYWRVDECPLENFSDYQRALADRFGGDPRVCDLPRVMRIPGFFHRKAEPYLVRLDSARVGPPWRLSELTLALGISIQKDRSAPKSFCGLLSPSVPSLIPATYGQRNSRLHAFARWLKAVEPEADKDRRREAVRDWYEQAEPACRTKDIGVYYDDFERAWQGVKTPSGSVLGRVLANLIEPPVELKALGLGDKGNLLVKVLYTLHLHQAQNHGGEPIIMGARTAAGLLQIDKNDANKLLRCLAGDGVLELIERGSGARASRWRWIWAADHGVSRENDPRLHDLPETY
jgi:hypothetical protein